MLVQRACWRASRILAPSNPSLHPLRCYSTPPPATAVEEARNAISPRWLSDTKSRIGRCLTFGLTSPQVDEAGKLLKVLGEDWRELVAGSEGYLTFTGLGQNIVWGDQDSMGHVNNVMYVRFAESGRCNWIRNHGRHVHHPSHRSRWEELLTPRSMGLILKSITVDFKLPITWPDRISVYHKLRTRPDETTQSLVLDVVIMSEAKQRPAARCLEDVVVYDYRAGKKSTLEPFMLEQFKHIFDLQEAAKQENQMKVRVIQQRVEALEKESWDRPDAKEDLGSAQR